jgi:glycolate oxidase iron-sulfur subunit
MAVSELLPLYDLITKCNRCGFCQAGCPVYRVTGFEHSLARGRLALARALIEGQLDLTPEVMQALEDCLLCRGCTPHCFPAIKTDEIVGAVRQVYLNRYGQPALQRLLFRRVLPDPDLLERFGRIAAWAKRGGLADIAYRTGLLGLIDNRLAVANTVVQSMPARTLRQRVQDRTPAPSKTRYRVGYFVSCGFNFQFPEVAEATLRVLERHGCAVTVLENTCCGRPAHAYGDMEAAREIARRNLDRLAPAMELDAIISECGSCSTHLKDYGHLLKDDAGYAARAGALSAKVQSFSEFLVATGVNGFPAGLAGTVTYHDPCHLSNRFAKVTVQPRTLLQSIPGLTYRELPEADWCCGAAGSYTFLHHQEAVGILDRKMGNVEKTGVTLLTTECPACMMHLAYGVRRHRMPVQVRHISQLLDEASASDATRPRFS